MTQVQCGVLCPAVICWLVSHGITQSTQEQEKLLPGCDSIPFCLLYCIVTLEGHQLLAAWNLLKQALHSKPTNYDFIVPTLDVRAHRLFVLAMYFKVHGSLPLPKLTNYLATETLTSSSWPCCAWNSISNGSMLFAVYDPLPHCMTEFVADFSNDWSAYLYARLKLSASPLEKRPSCA